MASDEVNGSHPARSENIELNFDEADNLAFSETGSLSLDSVGGVDTPEGSTHDVVSSDLVVHRNPLAKEAVRSSSLEALEGRNLIVNDAQPAGYSDSVKESIEKLAKLKADEAIESDVKKSLEDTDHREKVNVDQAVKSTVKSDTRQDTEEKSDNASFRGKLEAVKDWAVENPAKATVVTVGLAAVAAPVAVFTPVLGAVGFTSSGVVAGSAAAGMQASIGNVVAGSAFAVAQSAAAGGSGVATATAVTQGVGAVAAACSVLSSAWKGKKKPAEKPEAETKSKL